MSRNAVYKISGIEFANSNSEKAIDEQDENSQTAKQSKNDAKRGLAEIHPNIVHVDRDTISNDSIVLDPILNLKLQDSSAKLNSNVVEVASSVSTKPTSSIVTRLQTKKVKDQEFQDSINFQSTESFSASQTPQRNSSVADNDDINISPLVINHPWISTTRGSSSKKQRSELETSSNEEPESSPLLKKRSLSQRKPPIELSNTEALHFRLQMAIKISHLADLCNCYEKLLKRCEISKEEEGSVSTVIRQARDLQDERFPEFAVLVTNFEKKTGEKEITLTDLEEIWERICLQVSDVEKRFEELEKLKQKYLVHSDEMSPLSTPGKRESLRESALLNSVKKLESIVTNVVPTNAEESTEFTPGQQKKTFRQRDLNVVQSTSPEKCLSVEFDALKSDAEGLPFSSELKVFRSPRENIGLNLDDDECTVEETVLSSPRRSAS